MADDLRNALLEALRSHRGGFLRSDDSLIPAALLPVVRAYGNQRAAEALREAAAHPAIGRAAGGLLRDFADALTPVDTPEAHRG